VVSATTRSCPYDGGDTEDQKPVGELVQGAGDEEPMPLSTGLPLESLVNMLTPDAIGAHAEDQLVIVQ
jgi:hypothetical protein